jgi:hypothetical protein
VQQTELVCLALQQIAIFTGHNLKVKTESRLRNVVLQIKNRTMDKIQNCYGKHNVSETGSVPVSR